MVRLLAEDGHFPGRVDLVDLLGRDVGKVDVPVGVHGRAFGEGVLAVHFLDGACRPEAGNRVRLLVVRQSDPNRTGRGSLSLLFGVTQFSALATIRNPSVHLVATGSGSAGVFAPFAVSNR